MDRNGAFIGLAAMSVLAVVSAILFVFNQNGPIVVRTTSSSATPTASTVATPSPQTATATNPTLVAPPLTKALSRVTKKGFGLFVEPGNSPVSPERFRGYHTGVDFETFPDEQAADVSVEAICQGPLLMKKWAAGYGGVAVQQCVIANQDVTVVYGHLRLSSILFRVGDQMAAGQSFAYLGRGFSTETDGERKHLHLGIHKGTAVDILGYVQKQSDLSQWLDVRDYLGAK